jgi:hypothetical protein
MLTALLLSGCAPEVPVAATTPVLTCLDEPPSFARELPEDGGTSLAGDVELELGTRGGATAELTLEVTAPTETLAVTYSVELEDEPILRERVEFFALGDWSAEDCRGALFLSLVFVPAESSTPFVPWMCSLVGQTASFNLELTPIEGEVPSSSGSEPLVLGMTEATYAELCQPTGN